MTKYKFGASYNCRIYSSPCHFDIGTADIKDSTIDAHSNDVYLLELALLASAPAGVKAIRRHNLIGKETDSSGQIVSILSHVENDGELQLGIRRMTPVKLKVIK